MRLPVLASARGRGSLLRASPRALRRSPADRAALAAYDVLLEGLAPRQVVVLGSPAAGPLLGEALHRARPGARVTVLTSVPPPAAPDGPDARRRPDAHRPEGVEVLPCRNVHQAHDALLARPAPDLLVDDGGCPASLRHAVFLHLLPALVDGGRYLLRDGGASEEELDDRDGEPLPALLARLVAGAAAPVAASGPGPQAAGHPDDRERARMVGAHRVHDGVWMITKAGRHLAKVREEEADHVLPGRLGPGRCTVLVRRPAERVAARAELHSNRPELDGPFLRAFDVPARTLRVHHDVVCHPRQLALADDAMLPASFHHPQKRRPRNRGTVDAARWYARLEHEPDGPTELDGTWYHLASEFPGHFGHVLTEDLSRLWGWDEARRAYGDLRLLLGAGDPEPPGFLLELLTAFGIPAEDVVTAPGPVRVERLVSATPQLHNGLYVDPALEATWDRVAGALTDPAPVGAPRRIFVTRPPGAPRRCLDGEALEARFVAAGFAVVRPETMPLRAQVSLFAGAEVVAGYAGSGLFTALASRPGTVCVVFGSESYTAINEWLISAVKGFEHHHFWCPTTRPATPGAFDRSAFHADFRFDTARDSRRLDALLERIGG